MRKLLYLAVGIVAIVCMAFLASMLHRQDLARDTQVQETGLSVEEAATAETPKFEDFSVPPFVQKEQMATSAVAFGQYPDAQKYKEEILTALRKGMHFAGAYVLVTIPCGKTCQESVIVEAATGEVVYAGLFSAYGVTYRDDSTLLIVNPQERWNSAWALPSELIPNFGTDYYVWENEKLQFLFKQDAEGRRVGGCPELAVKARNTLTKEVRDFPSRCFIPSGWIEEIGKVGDSRNSSSSVDVP